MTVQALSTDNVNYAIDFAKLRLQSLSPQPGRPVDHGQHLRGNRLGCGQESRAEARDRQVLVGADDRAGRLKWYRLTGPPPAIEAALTGHAARGERTSG